jgi:hypothetical protein
MSVASVGSSATWNVVSAGSTVDPGTRRAQVNEQADTLSQLMGSRQSTKVAANISDGKGVDLYM